MSIQPALFPIPANSVPGEDLRQAVSEEKRRGAVATRQEVVEFMLDLLGYTPDQPLHRMRLLEPSCGSGQFLLAVVERLLSAWRAGGGADDSELDNAIRAVEMDVSTSEAVRERLSSLLRSANLPELSSQRLVRSWLVNGDFLTHDFAGGFDFIVGNPPYVRQENLPPALLAQYRSSFSTMIGRADLYVPFFERSLSLLKPNGHLSFICADAWTKNDYGRELRKLVAKGFALRAYVDMYGVDAFESEVGAYPSITVIARSTRGPVRTIRAESATARQLGEVLRQLRSPSSNNTTSHPPAGGGPWLLHSNHRLDAIRLIEQTCPSLEQAECKVGIGVATGADQVYVRPFDELAVEESRRLPLAVNKDVVNGILSWTGTGVVNPWDDAGSLVDLEAFPLLAAYLAPHRERLSRRHTARRDTDRLWYKTIDRITPSLTWRPKLLVPDIRGDGDAIAYDPGTLYPHHNLYYITSTAWDLHALQAVLRSGIARLFVEAYAVKIGGGYLRFQAQYLRRIRIPAWSTVSPGSRDLLTEAGQTGTKVEPRVLEDLYNISPGALGFLAKESAR